MNAAQNISLDRMVSAVDKVRARLLRAAAALEEAGLLYAVVGGNAVAAWVTTVDESAVRNTRDVDVMIRRVDLDDAIRALEAAGFVYRHVAGLDVFLDEPGAKAHEAVHIVFANEFVKVAEPLPNPDVLDSAEADGFRILALDSLVRTKLTSFRDKDRVHIRDLIGVGLVDNSWLDKVDPSLRGRLQEIIDSPDG